MCIRDSHWILFPPRLHKGIGGRAFAVYPDAASAGGKGVSGVAEEPCRKGGGVQVGVAAARACGAQTRTYTRTHTHTHTCDDDAKWKNVRGQPSRHKAAGGEPRNEQRYYDFPI